MRYILIHAFLGSLVAVTLSCGTAKKAPQKALVSQSAQQQVDREAYSLANPLFTQKIDTIPAKGTTIEPKDEIVLDDALDIQKRTGIYKQADWAPAMHFDLRRPNYVIIHHTSQNSVAQTIRTFQVPHTKVSAHYVIGRDGRVVQMLNDYERAWHAGKSKWGSITDINSSSIGIELDNNGNELFPDPQINALLLLLDTLKSKYYIPDLNFIGHADIAPTRKDDPNVAFPWKKLADHGFGIWYNEDFLMDPPYNFNAIDALKIMGYDMRNLDAAIRAFKRKYIVKEVNTVLTDYDKKVLYDLYRKYY